MSTTTEQPPALVPELPATLTTRGVANAVGVCPETLLSWVETGHFPQPVRIGKRGWRRWPASAVRRWLMEKGGHHVA